MRKKIVDYIENCLTCLLANSAANRNEGEMQSVPNPGLPFEIIHVDHFGPLQDTEDGYKHILVIVDAFTRFTWLLPTKSTGTREVCQLLNDLFNTFGNPTEIVSDRGTAFTSADFVSFVNSLRIKQRLFAVASPWANGMVKRVNRFIKSSLMKLAETPKEWKRHIGTVQYVINNTFHSGLKSTPSKILLGYDQRNHTDKGLKDLVDNLLQIECDILKTRETHRDAAKEATELLRNYNNVGDYVLIRNLQGKPGENKKLKLNYKGPYMVAKVLDKNRYVIQDIPGFNLTSWPYNSILSPDKMKPWIKEIRRNKA